MLCVAAILTYSRTVLPVDKRPGDLPGPMHAELLGWIGSVVQAAETIG